MEFRRVGPEHRAELSQFQCARFREPWSDELEWAIQTGLAATLALGVLQCIGLWDGESLCGIAAWQQRPDDPTVCESSCIAVDLRYAGRGYGHLLKAEQIKEARNGGATVLVSLVDRRNRAMIRINRVAGAKFDTDTDDPERRYLVCTIGL